MYGYGFFQTLMNILIQAFGDILVTLDNFLIITPLLMIFHSLTNIQINIERTKTITNEP